MKNIKFHPFPRLRNYGIMEIGNQQGNIKITRQFSNISNNVFFDIKNPNYLYFLGGFVEG